MSSVETPPRVGGENSVERRCPRCDATLSAEQEWCLECGAAVGTRIAEPRGWRASLAIVGVLLALALIAVVLAIAELSRDAEGVQEVAGTPTPAAATPSATPAPGEEGGATPTPTASPLATPSASATPDSGGASPTAGLAEWPEGKTAWTIVLNSSGTQEDAERLAGELAAKGVPDVGVIDSDDFESLGPDSFVIFSGTYDSESEAQAALAKIRDQAGGGSTRRIVPAK